MLPLFHHPIDFFMAASWSLLYLTTTSRCSGARPRWLSIFCPLLSAFNTKIYSKLGPKIFPVKKKRKITSARFHIATFFPSFFILFSLTMRAEKKNLFFRTRSFSAVAVTVEKSIFPPRIFHCSSDWHFRCHNKTLFHGSLKSTSLIFQMTRRLKRRFKKTWNSLHSLQQRKRETEIFLLH